MWNQNLGCDYDRQSVQPLREFDGAAWDKRVQHTKLARRQQRVTRRLVREHRVAVHKGNRHGVYVRYVVGSPVVLGVLVVSGLHANRHLDVRHGTHKGAHLVAGEFERGVASLTARKLDSSEHVEPLMDELPRSDEVLQTPTSPLRVFV